MTINLVGRMTPEDAAKWLADQFEFSFCEECGKDADAHMVCIGPFGLPFAKCNVAEGEPEDEYERRQRG